MGTVIPEMTIHYARTRAAIHVPDVVRVSQLRRVVRPLEMDPAYFYEAGATPTNSIPGSALFIVGTISTFGSPLDFLDASDPSKDYTFYVHGMLSNGTTPTPAPPLGNFYTTTYTDGVIEVYEGTPRDAVFDPNPPNANVPSTFTNGTLILSGTISGLYWQSNDFTNFNSGNAEGHILWSGGLYFPLMSKGGTECPSLFTGGTTWLPSLNIAGYLFRHDCKIDLECPTPAKESTWGRVKKLYR
jgi:hypothetical protein